MRAIRTASTADLPARAPKVAGRSHWLVLLASAILESIWALALHESPEAPVLDDFDQLRSAAERDLVAARLGEIAATGIPIVIATTDPEDAARFTAPHPTVIAL